MKNLSKENLFKTALAAALLLAVALLSLSVSRQQLEARSRERTVSALSSAAAEQCATVVAALNGQFDMLSAIAYLLPADGGAATQSALLRVPLPRDCTELWYLSAEGGVTARSGDLSDATALPSAADLPASGAGIAVRQQDGALSIDLLVPVPAADGASPVGILCGTYEAAFLDRLLVDRVYGGMTQICIVGNGAQILAVNAPAQESGLVAGGDLLKRLCDGGMLPAETVAAMEADLAAMRPGTAALPETGAAACLIYRPIGAADWFLVMLAPPALVQRELSQPLNTLYALSAILFTGVLLLFGFIVFNERRQRSLASRARAQEIARLSTRAQTDALTGLLNRGAAEQHIQRFLADEGRAGRHALLMLDLDDFKSINDTCGHIAGDSVLFAIGERLRACIRASDVVSRFGGDEFMVLLKDAGTDEKILSVADKIIRAVSEIRMQDQAHIAVTVSIGIAVYEADDKRFTQLYDEADRALYRAKANGKERAVIFDPSMT